MGRTYDAIDAKLARFLLAQPVFFVATAPLSGAGHINCSPKGNRNDLAVLGDQRVAYLDLTGSGIETIAHLRENGRIVVMFCAFEGPPCIVRLHGRGEAIELHDERFGALAAHFPSKTGARAVILIEVERISDSCGYGVPIMPFDRHRQNLDHWVDTKSPEALQDYRHQKNSTSLDGLPGLVGDTTLP